MRKRDRSPGLFPERTDEILPFDDELLRVINKATYAETPAPNRANIEPLEEARGDAARRARLDSMFDNPSIANAIAVTTTECQEAGFGVLSVGILGKDSLIVQAQGIDGHSIQASGTPSQVLDVLREMIRKARSERNDKD